jgi:FkbM family methyltransferase
MRKYGFTPGFIELILRYLSNILIRLLNINGVTKFSNIFIQMLNPVYTFEWKQEGSIPLKLKYRTGHGRLLWRAKTFYTEEPMMINWLASFGPKDIYLDLGANVGTYSIPAALRGAMVYACELDPLNVGLLKENVHLNNVHDKIIIFPFGAAEKSYVAEIHYRDFSKGDALQSIGRESEFNTVIGEGKHVSLQLLFPIDLIFEMFNLDKPNKIKIDVDGNERSLFEGGKETIMGAKEIYFENSESDDCKIIINTLLDANYVIKSTQYFDDEPGGNMLFKKE